MKNGVVATDGGSGALKVSPNTVGLHFATSEDNILGASVGSRASRCQFLLNAIPPN